MKALFIKELRLALHPTAILFLFLSAMILIPNYPYYVIFFYNSLGVFFICLNGRENKDIYYTLSLPVPKRKIVAARMLLVVLLEMAQMVLAIPFAVLRGVLYTQGNLAGMDANLAFFGLSFIMLGLFHLVFFVQYYKNTDKVGVSFLLGAIAEFVFLGIVETLAHAMPFFRDCLDTPDPVCLGPKLVVFFVGILCYLLLTFLAYGRAAGSFEKLDF